MIWACVESVWALGFAAAGRLFHPPVAAWSSPGHRRVLVIAPHPDDEAVGCAGTIALHRRHGDELCIAYITDGRGSRALGLGPEEMAGRRKQEAEAGARALGVERVEWFGLPEWARTTDQLQPRLRALLDQYAPQIIYAPSRVDFHPEHHKVAHALAAALLDGRPEPPTPLVQNLATSSVLPKPVRCGRERSCSQGVSWPAPDRFSSPIPNMSVGNALVRIYQIQVPLTPLLTNLIAATDGVRAESAGAFNAYVTQADSIARASRSRHYAARFYRSGKQAEEFWQMTARQYAMLHSSPPDQWPTGAFRSLRARPLSDPLAYLRGLSERRRLADTAGIRDQGPGIRDQGPGIRNNTSSLLPKAAAGRRRSFALLIGLLLVYLAISLRNLTIVPQVYEDEPWQASTGWKLATEGVFGTDMFTGFYRMEQRYYGYMPLHPLLLAGMFRVAGLGLFQARLEAALLGLLTLVLTYSLARRLFDNPWIGPLAALFLIAVRLTGSTPSRVSGILFLDMARIARYDMVVPVLGLLSLHAYLSACRQGRSRWYIIAGLLAGLSSLAHLYGVFWLPVLLVLTLWDKLDRGDASTEGNSTLGRLAAAISALPAAGLVVFGFALPWLPYIAYVLGDLHNWRGQTRIYAERFELFDPRWYLDNLLREPRRYAPGLGPLRAAVLRVGFWSALVALPLSLGALAWRGLRHRDHSARAVAVPAVLLPVFFALLIHLKLTNYIVAFVPFGALAAAWGGVTLWAWLGRRSRWPRAALAMLLVAVLAEGATRVAALEAAARTTTPYYAYIEQVRRAIPPGARVLGLHTYWFGLEDFDYRSFAVPVLLTDPANEPAPLPFDVGLEQVAPDVVLLDPRMREYFNAPPQDGDEVPARFYRWLDRHDGRLVGRVEDTTYGLMEIYRVKR